MKLQDPSRQTDMTGSQRTFRGLAHVDSGTGCHPHGFWSAWLKVDKSSSVSSDIWNKGRRWSGG